MAHYIELKDDEATEKAERSDVRNKKKEDDRVGGEAIRNAALQLISQERNQR